MIMRVTGAKKKVIVYEMEQHKSYQNVIYSDHKKCSGIRKKDIISLTLIFATAAVVFIFIFMCIQFLIELHRITSESHYHFPRLLHRYSETTLFQLNSSLFDSFGYDYCHHPDKPVVGLEGFVPEGFELQQVHIFTNPGETSHAAFDASSTVFCEELSCSFPEFLKLHPRLRSFHERVHRHHRIKRHFLSNLVSGQNCDHELTPYGIHKLIALGEFFREIYIKDLGLESSKLKAKHIKVFSSSADITLKSSYALLFGFLTDDHLSQLQTTILSDSLCSKEGKSAHLNCECPLLTDEEKKLREQLSAGINLSKGDNPVMFQLFFRQIISNLCSDSNSSCFAQNIEIVKELLIDINLFYKKISEDTKFADLVYVFLYPLFDDLVKSFRLTEHIFEKLFLYSVDDHILFYMLNALKLPTMLWPRPGSRIVFELYKNSRQTFQPYYVRILYNGENISRFVSICSIKMENGLCRLKNFANLLQYKTSQKVDLKTAYDSYCSS